MRNAWPPLLLLIFSTQLTFWTAQGLGFFEQPLLVALGQRAADTATPPLLQNLAFALRFFVALLSDTWSPCGLGHRLPYIVAGQAIAAAALLAAGAVPPAPGPGWSAYLAAAFFRSAGIVAATSALDGLLVDAGTGSAPGSMGRVQAARATGIVVGQLLANLGGGALADALGLAALAFFLGGLTAPWAAAPLALAGGVVEEAAPEAAAAAAAAAAATAAATSKGLLPGGAGGRLRAAAAACAGSARAFASAPAAATLALSVLTFAGSTVGNFPLVLFLVGRKGLTLLDNGVLNTVFALASWLGSLAGAWLLERADVRLPTACAQLASAALTAAVLWTPAGRAFEYNAALNAAGGLATGLVITTTNAMALRLSPRGLSATFVALIAGASNAGGLLGNVLVGQIAAREDYFAIAFWTGAGILAAGAAAVPFLGAAARPPLAPAAAAAEAAAAAAAAAAGGEAAVAVGNPLAAAAQPLPPADAGAPQGPPLLPGAAAGVSEWGAPRQ